MADEYANLRAGMRQLAERLERLEGAVFAGDDQLPKRLPTSAQGGVSEYERARRKLRAAVLDAWAVGYGNAYMGRQYSPNAPNVKEHLESIIGMGGTPDDVLGAAKFMAAEAWWKKKGGAAPGLHHFARFYESYSIKAREAGGVAINDGERRAHERRERERQREKERREEALRMPSEEVGALAAGILDKLKGGL